MPRLRATFDTLSGLAVALTVVASVPAEAGAPQYFFGLQHAPQGGAALAVDAGGRLVVDNLGSSGQDGVSSTCLNRRRPAALRPNGRVRLTSALQARWPPARWFASR